MAEPASDAVTVAAADLYALPPEGFIAARTARAAELKRAGDADAAKAVGRLARPTAAASLVDRLVRESPELVHALLATGRDLREAQAELDAARLKALGADRRQRVADAVAGATAIGEAAGHLPGAAVVEELTATFTAAVLDEVAGGAVASGRLIRGLPAAGLEGSSSADLVALPEAPSVLGRAAPIPAAAPATAGAKAERDGRAEDRAAAARRWDAERAVEDAERVRDRAGRAAGDAEDDLADAGRRREDAGSRVADLQHRITELQHRLDAAENELRAADRDVRDRRTDERQARRAAEDAEDALAAARSRLERS